MRHGTHSLVSNIIYLSELLTELLLIFYTVINVVMEYVVAINSSNGQHGTIVSIIANQNKRFYQILKTKQIYDSF